MMKGLHNTFSGLKKMDHLTIYVCLLVVFCVKDVLCKLQRHPLRGNGSKIVGGEETTIQTYPYQAYLLLNDGRDNYQCGGSIVSERHVLTAAHCLSRIQTILVRIGSTNSNSGGLEYTTTDFDSHPRYNTDNSDYDVGIVFVNEGMNLDGTNARAISIVSFFNDPESDDNVVVTGWGATSEGGPTTDTLMVTSVPVVDRDECNEQLDGGITSRMFCAGLPEGGRDTCQGDSGGPAVLTSSGLLAGITSFGFGCARPNLPGVYTRIGDIEIWFYIIFMAGL